VVITRDLHLTGPVLAAYGSSRALVISLARRQLMAMGIRTTKGALLAVSVVGAGDDWFADQGIPATLIPCALTIMETLRNLKTRTGGRADGLASTVPIHRTGARRHAPLVDAQRALSTLGIFSACHHLPAPPVRATRGAFSTVSVHVARAGRYTDPAWITRRSPRALDVGAARENLDLFRARADIQQQGSKNRELEYKR